MLYTATLCVLVIARAVTCDWPFDTTFLFWFWQSAVVVDQWLYIDGGEYYTRRGDSIGLHTHLALSVAATVSIDISQPWTIDSVSAHNNSNKPSSMPLVRRPPLWYDTGRNIVMERGGWQYTISPTLDLWTFSPDGQGGAAWSLNGLASINASKLNPTFGGAFTASASSFYSLGGVIAYGSITGFALEGLTIYDFRTGKWSNVTSAGWQQSGYSVQSQAVFMPNFGQEGLVLFLGGDAPSNQTYQYEEGAALVDFSDIVIYDPAIGTWYHQPATGSVPPPRSEFCVVGSASKDNSSFELFVFGGSTNRTFDVVHANDEGYLDVFILSLPAFVWFKAGSATQVRRSKHFCQLLGNGHMLVIGGIDPSLNVTQFIGYVNMVDPWTRGMNIFNMNSLNWTGAYSPSATYDRPIIIQQYYAEHSSETKWTNTSLAALFSPKPSKTSEPNRTSSPTSKPSHTGAIAGGVIGGIAGITLMMIVIVALYFFCRRHRRSSPKPESPPYGISAGSVIRSEETDTFELPAASDNPNPSELPAAIVGDDPTAPKRKKRLHRHSPSKPESPPYGISAGSVIRSEETDTFELPAAIVGDGPTAPRRKKHVS
ncbi:MAG: hypothetical protein M1812_006105 [Candelaria pacifica]|nr:MAG: hypothetical protein M1812_006105 [Candelaria pacifica]